MARGKKEASAKAAEALTPSHRLVLDLRKQFKDEAIAIRMAEGGYARVTQVCPTGIDVLDRHIIGIGGLPYGQPTELLGDEGAGKTTLLCKFMAAAQRDGCLVAFADAETKFVPEWGALHGIDLEALVLTQPETVEDLHDHWFFILQRHRARKQPLMLALDSIAAMPTRVEMKEGRDLPAEHARLWTAFGRQFKMKVAQQQVLVVWVNQPRSNVGVMYGPKETSFGGRWLRHAPLVRLHVSHGKSVKDGGVSVARYMHVRAMKNQVAPPHRSGTLKLDYGEGFDDDWATIEHAKEVGCLEAKAPHTEASLREARKNLGWLPPVEEVAS